MILSGQTLTKIVNLHCDLDLTHNTPIVSQDAVPSNQVGCKRISGSEDKVEWALIVTLTLPIANLSQDPPAHNDAPPN